MPLPHVEQAEHSCREVLDPAEALGMRPLQARCHLGLGKLHRQLGHGEEARLELGRAVEMLRDMGMAHWLPEAQAELAAVTASAGTRSG